MYIKRPDYAGIIMEFGGSNMWYKCQQFLTTFKQIKDHWEKGCFDETINKDEEWIGEINKLIIIEKDFLEWLKDNNFDHSFCAGRIEGLELVKDILRK